MNRIHIKFYGDSLSSIALIPAPIWMMKKKAATAGWAPAREEEGGGGGVRWAAWTMVGIQSSGPGIFVRLSLQCRFTSS